MKTLVCEINEESGYVVPISDLHLGDKSFTKRSLDTLNSTLKVVKEKDAKVVLVGDIFNCATRFSKTSPFEQTDREFERAIEIFKPYSNNILTAVDGNHEFRQDDFANFSIMNAFCLALGINYSHISVAINFKVGKRDAKRFRQQYIGYFHHSNGGGKTMGSKLNRSEEMTKILTNADFYVSGHHHGLFSSPLISKEYNIRTNKIDNRRQLLIGSGGYLDWDESYAERAMLRPVDLGSPLIELYGSHDKNIKVYL